MEAAQLVEEAEKWQVMCTAAIVSKRPLRLLSIFVTFRLETVEHMPQRSRKKAYNRKIGIKASQHNSIVCCYMCTCNACAGSPNGMTSFSCFRSSRQPLRSPSRPTPSRLRTIVISTLFQVVFHNWRFVFGHRDRVRKGWSCLH